MKHSSLFLAVPVALVAATSLSAQTLVDTRLRQQTWASGLTSPTAFGWIAADEMLVFQKNDGMVMWVKQGAAPAMALDLAVNTDSERGGLGIAIDPDFATNRWVYLYYSSTSGMSDSNSSANWVDNRVVRYDWNGSMLVNPFGPIIAFAKSATQSNGPNHDGGVIRFGPDGMLYGQVGDLNRGRFGPATKRIEQNTATTNSAMVGGIFRLVKDGSIPADNPFVTESDSNLHLWYSYGVRNAYGLTFDALTGTMWGTENGPNVYDEVNRIPKGMNSGWLKIMGPDSRDATYFENANTAFNASNLTYLVNAVYVDPELSFKSPIGITALSFVHSKRFPEDVRDQLVFGDNNTGNLYFVTMNATRDAFVLPTGLTDKVADSTTERNSIMWGSSWSTATDIQVGADGYLYVASHGLGRIIKIRPVTDLVEPAMLLPVQGTGVLGPRSNFDVSDDQHVTLTQDRTGANPLDVRARFQLNEASPTAISIEIEDKLTEAAFAQDLYVRNVPGATWDLVEHVVLGTSDSPRTLVLSNPTNYVDPTALTLEARLVVTPIGPAGTPPGASQPRATLKVDLLRLDVTYP